MSDDLSLSPELIWVGLGLTGLAFVLLVASRKRSDGVFGSADGPAQTIRGEGPRVKVPLPEPPLFGQEKPPPALAPMPLAARDEKDRRAGFRRVGNAIPLLVADAEFKSPPKSTWVIDRSRQGLRFALDWAVPAATVLQVRPANAPDAAPWLSVEVRYNVPAGDQFEVGCRFLEQPSWETLLLFG